MRPLSAMVDVRRVREKLKLSQRQFAARFGFFARGRVRNWEQGRNRPAGAARILIAVIERHPEAVEDVIRSEPRALRSQTLPSEAEILGGIRSSLRVGGAEDGAGVRPGAVSANRLPSDVAYSAAMIHCSHIAGLLPISPSQARTPRAYTVGLRVATSSPSPWRG